MGTSILINSPINTIGNTISKAKAYELPWSSSTIKKSLSYEEVKSVNDGEKSGIVLQIEPKNALNGIIPCHIGSFNLSELDSSIENIFIPSSINGTSYLIDTIYHIAVLLCAAGANATLTKGLGLKLSNTTTILYKKNSTSMDQPMNQGSLIYWAIP